MTNKEKFLMEHNRLSPLSLQANLALLTQFREAKISLFKDNDWSVDKLRRHFILWLTSLPLAEKENNKNSKRETKDKNKKLFHIYPQNES